MQWSPAIRAWRTAVVSAAALIAACGLVQPLKAEPIQLRGAGSTFAAPLYKKWAAGFAEKNSAVAVHYDAVGSGEGIGRFMANIIDFGGSDVPLSPQEAADISRGAIEVPSTAGMIVLAYNLPGLGGQLSLPHDVYVDIFLGRIRTWNDPRIAAANPGLALPSANIAVVVRQDSSGTTYAFTSHLAASSDAWTVQGPGVGKVIDWPHVAMNARGNEGVASRIKISEGSIGYVEYGFAHRLGLPVAILQNRDGHFVAPSQDSGQAALSASAASDLKSLSATLVNPAGADAYPIVTYSWLLLYGAYPSERAKALAGFVDYGLTEGQQEAADLGYLALPPAIADLGRKALAGIKEADARGE